MAVKFSKFKFTNMSGVKVSAKLRVPDTAWWAYNGATQANLADALVPVTALYAAAGLGPSAWFDSYTNGTINEVSLQDAAVPLAAVYTLASGEGVSSNGPVWFASYASGVSNEASLQDAAVPTSTLYNAPPIPDSPWYSSYSGSATDTASLQDATVPTSSNYNTANGVPADTTWWTSYSSGTSQASLQDATVPTSAVQAA